MRLTQASYLALRLTFAQNVPAPRSHSDRLVFPAAFLLASIGVGVSSYSIKQMAATRKQR